MQLLRLDGPNAIHDQYPAAYPRKIQHPRLLSVTITHKSELYQVLQTFCSRRRAPCLNTRSRNGSAGAAARARFFPHLLRGRTTRYHDRVAAYACPHGRGWSYARCLPEPALRHHGSVENLRVVLTATPAWPFYSIPTPKLPLAGGAHVFWPRDFFRTNVLFAPTTAT